ncbi:aspartyl-phosphate phosphatase Spo0E family protein [Brevibacillus sp. NL20B1]|uniref:aspartyl-phosphate phosphatase Spo0E family protein n=1 Tax=Brevibacillus sp. NL20B1 TaxID=2829799 RepID=UPI001B8F9256|nr:aspartyl-phosphate phosphatase Spo0E family protein [Brevibacillus sp. NL20B1]MBR8660527.1 aspartyl-phosphate phosphatase Spo0E family protein [Brevibacillus sp. NL20B1]
MEGWRAKNHEDVSQIIENLQKQLNEIVKQKGSLTDCAVLRVSQELDRYIVERQRMLLESRKGRILLRSPYRKNPG